MASPSLQDLRVHVEETRVEIERAAVCVACLADGSRQWCRLLLTQCLVSGGPTTPDRRAQSGESAPGR